MESVAAYSQCLQQADACYRLAKQQIKLELAERVYEEAIMCFENLKRKKSSPNLLHERLAELHFDYGNLLQQIGKSQHACKHFILAQEYEHPEEAKKSWLRSSSHCPYLRALDRIHNTAQLSTVLLWEEDCKHLHLLATQIFKDFIDLPTHQREMEHFAEIAALGAPQDRKLTHRLLSCALRELETRPLLFIHHLRFLTSLLEAAFPAHLSGENFVQILSVIDHHLEQADQLPKDEPEWICLMQALAALFTAMEGVNVDKIIQTNIVDKLKNITDHESLQVRVHAHVASQALARMSHDEKKLIPFIRRKMPKVVSGTHPWIKLLNSTTNSPLSLIRVAVGNVDQFLKLSQIFEDFQRDFRSQEAQERWYDVWSFARLLLQTRPFDDFECFFQNYGSDFETSEHLLFKGCIELFILHLNSETISWQREALDFLSRKFIACNSISLSKYIANAILQIRDNALNDDVCSQAADTLAALQDNLFISEEKEIIISNSCDCLAMPIFNSSQRSAPLLFDPAREKMNQPLLQWILKQSLQRMEKTEHEAVFYVPLQGTAPSSSARFLIEEKIRTFLVSNGRILLLKGSSGAGKTVFCHQIEHLLWEERIAIHGMDAMIPWYISFYELLHQEGNSLLEKVQANMQQKLHSHQLEQLKRYPLLFLLDGYNEWEEHLPFAQSTTFFQEWPQARFLITCHCNRAITFSGCRHLFPLTRDHNTTSFLQEISIAPLNQEQIEHYLDNYLIKKKSCWSAEQYRHALGTVPNFLLRTPLLLFLVIETLPTLLAADVLLEHLNRFQLYDAYINQWQKINKLNSTKQESPTAEACTQFAQDLAYEMLLVKQFTVDCSKREIEFRFLDNRYYFLRLGIPIFSNESFYQFSHVSLLEYFAARKIFTALIAFPADATWINARLFTEDAGLLSFLVDCVHESSLFQERLFELVMASKTHSDQEIASANALTILNFARIPFSDCNLRAIRAPGAVLDHAVLDHTDLRQANLSRCSLRAAFLGGSRLEEALLVGSLLGEQAALLHEGSASSISFSPDGKLLASASWDRNVRLWEVATGELLRTLRGHEDWVSSVSFSPDGQLLASTSKDQTVHLWEVAAGQLLKTLRGRDSIVERASFSPDGQLLATANDDHTVCLWALATEQLFQILYGHESAVSSVDFSPDGEQLASASWDHTVCLWEVATGQQLQVLRGHEDWAKDVRFSPNGQFLASASDDHTVCLWEVTTGQLLHTLSGHGAAVESISFSPDGQTLASASKDRTIRIWHVATGELLATLCGHTSVVASVNFSPDGQLLASASWDQTARLWEAKPMLQDSSRHQSSILSISFSPDGQLLSLAHKDQTLSLWEVNTGQLLQTLHGHESDVLSTCFSPDGQLLASASADRTVKLWKREIDQVSQILCGHENSVTSICFSPDGQLLASASADCTACLWQVAFGKLLQALIGHRDEVCSVSFSPDGQWLASASKDQTVCLWGVISGRLVQILRGHEDWVTGILFLSDQQLISASKDRTTRLWEVSSGQLIRILKRHTNEVESFSCSSDIQHLISTSMRREVDIWEAISGQLLQTLRGHDSLVTSVSFSPSGQFLASASLDGTARIWRRGIRNHFSLEWSTPHSLFCNGARIHGACLSVGQKALFLEKGALD